MSCCSGGSIYMKKSGFRKPTYEEYILSLAKKQGKIGLKRSKIRVKGISSTTEQKDEIQGLIRQIAILRDKVCVLSHYPETGSCGGYRKDGELILQFDHLNSRVHSISFGDPRLGVLLCRNHHIFYKKREPDYFSKIVRKHIGVERSCLLDKVQLDRSPHKMDWKLIILDLKQQIKRLQ